VMDAKKGSKQEIPLPSVGELATPAFSPDGRRVVFSGLVGGFTDLFVYDLQSKELKRLTNDAFADLQPAWSPDGKHIAFVTDRFSTNLETPDAGNYRLAVIDVDTSEIKALPSLHEGKNINPQWSRDGKDLYFLSDQTGITNVYRLDVTTAEVF